ncbi:MAG: hypothetical protein KME17_24155 [Cyanosarcina radialis HA8281-LM2]|nr:hypothetical protein [Cyanosarcina radialis HA8281-LM2]
MKNIHLSAIAVLSTVGVVAGAPSVLAEETVCQGTIGAVTVVNVKVPTNGTCTLNGTTVQGTIKVESNAALRAIGVSVVGDIQAEGARSVVVSRNTTTNTRSIIGGSIQLYKGVAGSNSVAANINGSQINGDLQLIENRGQLTANGNQIGGSLQAFQNLGGLTIRNNRINGNLQCKENNPAPTGGSNIVQGTKEDQCSNL